MSRVKSLLYLIIRVNLVILIIFFPYDLYYSNIMLVIAIILLFFYVTIYRRDKIYKQNTFVFILVSLFYFWRICSLFYSDDIAQSLTNLTQSLSLFALPLLIIVFDAFGKALYKSLIKAHMIGILILFIVVETSIIYQIFADNKDLTWLFSWQYGYNNLANILGNGSNYISLYITIICLYVNINLTKKAGSILEYTIFIVSILLLFQFQNRNHIIFLIFFSFSLLLYYKRYKVLLTSAFILVLLLKFMIDSEDSNMRYYERRFVESFSINELFEGEKRLNRWAASIDLIKNNFWIGTGNGDIGKVRNEYFVKHGLVKSANKGYNDHNQYIQIFATYGFVGILLFAVHVFIYFFVVSKSKMRSYYLIFYCFFLFAFLTESVLERNKGIVLYSLYFSVALNSSLRTYRINSNEKLDNE